MSGYDLRPLSLGELLDRAFALYRRNFALFAGILAVPSCLIVPMESYLLYARGLPFLKVHTGHGFPGMNFAFILIDWNLYAFAQAATTYAVADTYLGRDNSIAGAYAQALRHSWEILGVCWNVWLRMMGMFVVALIPLFVVAAIVVALFMREIGPRDPAGVAAAAVMLVGAVLAALLFCARYFVALPAALLEGAGTRGGIRRSVVLTKGRRWQALAAGFLGLVVTYAAASLFQGPFYVVMSVWKLQRAPSVWLAVSFAALSSLGAMFAAPVAMIIPVLLYYDFRIRKEAFDLQRMMASLPEERATAPGSLA